jgi:hypothetical protein
MHRLLTVAILAPLAALAPAAPVPKAADKPPLFHPTRVGDTSVYSECGCDSTYVVTGVEDRDGAKLVTTRREPSAEAGSYETLVRVAPDGVFEVSTGSITLTPPMCRLRLPHKDGASWSGRTNYRTVPTPREWTSTTVGWETVEVPAGRVRAIRVEHEYRWVGLPGEGLHKETYWHSPGLGVVKWVSGQKAGVLKKFTPGK